MGWEAGSVGGGLVFELCTVCVADIDESPGRRVKPGMVALVCEVAPGERQTGRRIKEEGRGGHAHARN